MGKINAGLKIEEIIKKKLEYIAQDEGISYADLSRMIIFNYIQEYEKKKGKIDSSTLYQMNLLHGGK